MTVQADFVPEQVELQTGSDIITVNSPILDETHIQVYRSRSNVRTLLTLNSHYTVSGVGNENAFTVTMVGQAVGDIITVYRNMPFTQLQDIQNGTPRSGPLAEKGLDERNMEGQQLKENYQRALRLPFGEDPGNSGELPSPDDRRGKILIFDDTDAALPSVVNQGTSTGITGAARQYGIVSAMTSDTSIVSVATGQAILLRGYYADGDFGQAITLIVEAGASGLNSFLLNDGRYANLYVDGYIRPEWFGAKGDGVTDDIAAFNSALSYLGSQTTGGTVLLRAGKIYAVSQAIVYTNHYQTITGEGGLARIISTSTDDAVRCESWFRCALRSVDIRSSTCKTLIRVGEGDTWYFSGRDIYLEGNGSVIQGVCLWNDTAGDVRDYFHEWHRVQVRNCDYAFAIGVDFSTGSYVAAGEQVNRIKLLDCDVYGASEYAVVLGNGNGHYIHGIHFTNAVAGCKADFYISNTNWNHITSQHESGADHAIHFESAFPLGMNIQPFIFLTYAVGPIATGAFGSPVAVTNQLTSLFSLAVDQTNAYGTVLRAKNVVTEALRGMTARELAIIGDDTDEISMKFADNSVAFPTLGSQVFQMLPNGNMNLLEHPAYERTFAANITLTSFTETDIDWDTLINERGSNTYATPSMSLTPGRWLISLTLELPNVAGNDGDPIWVQIVNQFTGRRIAAGNFAQSTQPGDWYINLSALTYVSNLNEIYKVRVRSAGSSSTIINGGATHSFISAMRLP